MATRKTIPEIARPTGWPAALAAATFVGACAGRPSVTSVPVGGGDRCVVATDPVAPPLDTVTIAVAGSIGPGDLTGPDGAAEQLAARQLYAGLARLDCEGRLVPDLALGWRREAGGEDWMVELRPDARFGDGSPIDAESVRSGWLAVDSIRQWMARGLIRAEVAGPRRLRVGFAAAVDSAPMLLADPALAVRGPPTAAGNRATSGGYRPASDSSAAEMILTPVVAGPVLRIVPLAAAGDPRDALDRGSSPVDLLVTRDPNTLGYAVGRPRLEVVPLPWDRTYALVLPRPLAEGPDPAARDELAREAVRSEARGAVPPFWWERDPGCRVPRPASAPAAPASVAYAAGDDIGRALAERIVALTAGSTRPAWLGGLTGPRPEPLRVVARDRTGLRAAVAAGGPALVALPRAPRAGCLGAQVGEDRSLVPLIDSRARLVIRRGSPPLRIEGDGIFRVLPR